MRVKASSALEETQAKRVLQSEPWRLSKQYEPGGLVLQHQTQLESTYLTQAKMAPRWVGPFIVLKCLRKTYLIHNLMTSQDEQTHQDRLKPYWPQTEQLMIES